MAEPVVARGPAAGTWLVETDGVTRDVPSGSGVVMVTSPLRFG